MFWNRLSEYINKDQAIPHFIKALFHLLSHWGSQAAISIIGTIVIAVLIGSTVHWVWLVSACVLYVILVVGTLFCQQYTKWKESEKFNKILEEITSKGTLEHQNEMLISIMNSIRTLEMAASAGIYRNARTIKHEGWISSLKDMREAFGFQSMAMQVCQEVYNILQKQFGWAEHSVTVFQRFKRTEKNNVCKMIAYSIQNGQEPSSYSQEYSIPRTISQTRSVAKPCFHTRIFTENSTEIRVLTNNEEVHQNFKFHKNCENREKAIEQYIGIPMKVCNRDVTFILQVDCNIKGAFGKTKDEMIMFAKKYLYQYASLLALCYEIDRSVEVAYDHEQKSQQKEGKAHVQQHAITANSEKEESA